VDFDQIADNEDQLYKDLLEEEARDEKKVPKTRPTTSNNYDDEGAYGN
jgi:hypothetical protein